LGRRLLRKVAAGGDSVKSVQETALDALNDGLQNKLVGAIASLGSYGMNSQNAERDLHTWVQKSTKDMVPIPGVVPGVLVEDAEGSGMVAVDWPVLWPHEMFAAVHRYSPNLFVQLFAPGGEDALQEYWEHEKNFNTEFFDNHPTWSAAAPAVQLRSTRHAVPWAVHADAGSTKAQHAKKYMLIQSGPATVMNKDRPPRVDSLLVYTAIPDDICIPQVSHERLYEGLVWSLHWLHMGCWPLFVVDKQGYTEGSIEHSRQGQALARPRLPRLRGTEEI